MLRDDATMMRACINHATKFQAIRYGMIRRALKAQKRANVLQCVRDFLLNEFENHKTEKNQLANFGPRKGLCFSSHKKHQLFGYNVKNSEVVYFLTSEGNETSKQIRFDHPPPRKTQFTSDITSKLQTWCTYIHARQIGSYKVIRYLIELLVRSVISMVLKKLTA